MSDESSVKAIHLVAWGETGEFEREIADPMKWTDSTKPMIADIDLRLSIIIFAKF